jgi:putative ABC transport system ATP-binding protein
MFMLRINQLNKSFDQPDGKVSVLQQASLQLEAGQSAALLGESGSGKSTLLHLIAGLDRADGGEIWLQQQPLHQFNDEQFNQLRRTQLSLIFQQYHLVPTLTVFDNLSLQARLSGHLDDDFRQHLIATLGLAPLLKRLPQQLSGGQQQRVAIARSLLHRPALVLADEPTGNLDENTSQQVMQLLSQLVRDNGSSLLMVTHSPAMAAYCDHSWRLHHGRLHAEPSA